MDDRQPRSFNFADIWEAVAPQVGSRTALVCGAQRRTYAELERRVNQLARHLHVSGLGPGDRIGIFLRNGAEYIETMLAAFTIRAVPVNVNYRYVADELHHLLADSEATALVYHRSLEPAVIGVLGRVPPMRTLLVVHDRAVDDRAAATSPPADDRAAATSPPAAARAFEDALAAEADHRLDVADRSGDDRYLMYTGGTTGLPKGVLWRQEDAFFGCIGGGDPMRLNGPVTDPGEIPERIVEGFSFLPVAPLMHAAAQWTTLSWLFAGGKTTLMPGGLDPAAVWQAVQDEAANSLTVVGDAVGRPLVAAWEAEPDRWNISSLFSISNGGAPMSPTLKARLAQLFPG
ncbi:MAG: AMP-binding protein, partial [Actinomycetota bacterium]|nr:AMP-binding protein [Actinomycetota bacterium]